MKKLLIIIMCSMLIAGCSSTDNKTAESHSKPVQQEIVKKDQTEQEKTVDKKEETKTENKNKTETVKKEEKKENQKKTTKKTTDSTSKKTSTKKKTNTTKKSTTKKKTTPKKKKTDSITGKAIDYGCIDCGKHFKTEKEIKKHLKESGHGQYSIAYETDEEWPEDWVSIE